MSDKSLVFDLCISKHDATAVKKKKKTLLLFGPVRLVRADLSTWHRATYGTKRKPNILARHQGNASTSTAGPTGFPVPRRERGNSDEAGVNMGKMKSANRQSGEIKG